MNRLVSRRSLYRQQSILSCVQEHLQRLGRVEARWLVTDRQLHIVIGLASWETSLPEKCTTLSVLVVRLQHACHIPLPRIESLDFYSNSHPPFVEMINIHLADVSLPNFSVCCAILRVGIPAGEEESFHLSTHLSYTKVAGNRKRSENVAKMKFDLYTKY